MQFVYGEGRLHLIFQERFTEWAGGVCVYRGRTTFNISGTAYRVGGGSLFMEKAEAAGTRNTKQKRKALENILVGRKQIIKRVYFNFYCSSLNFHLYFPLEIFSYFLYNLLVTFGYIYLDMDFCHD